MHPRSSGGGGVAFGLLDSLLKRLLPHCQSYFRQEECHPFCPCSFTLDASQAAQHNLGSPGTGKGFFPASVYEKPSTVGSRSCWHAADQIYVPYIDVT